MKSPDKCLLPDASTKIFFVRKFVVEIPVCTRWVICFTFVLRRNTKHGHVSHNSKSARVYDVDLLHSENTQIKKETNLFRVGRFL